MSDVYDNPLIGRYASAEMAQRWGPLRKFRTWRRLWLALAESQAELGLRDVAGQPRIKPEQLAALRAHLDDIDLARADQHERRLRHDVMAHIHALADVCPEARDIIHLGATSCYVTDNTDLLLMRESLGDIRQSLVAVIDALARFAVQHQAIPALGYTHFQPAQLTTVGKRACLWCYDLVMDLEEIEHRWASLRFRGAKGTTGTQASFLALFQGDHQRVRELDRRVALKMGFAKTYEVTGQTYSRKVDTQVLETLGGLGQSLSKWGHDLRLLAHEQEVEEPIEAEQVGSSAMAYKRNPMRAERMCGLARYLLGLPAIAAQTAATQWLERTLDDSATRRLTLPQAFLCADAILRIALNLANGLTVRPATIARHVRESLPYMATENWMMAAVARGADRQEVHEVIRRHSHAVAQETAEGRASATELLTRLAQEPIFTGVDLAAELEPSRYIGRAVEQVSEFVAQVIEPIRARYPAACGRTAEVHV